MEISRLDHTIINIALDELMRAAIDGGASSHACEVIASIMTPLSSINVRGQILSKMRKAGWSSLNHGHFLTKDDRRLAKLL